MWTNLLKVGKLEILRDGDRWGVAEGRKPDGDFRMFRETGSLVEAAVLLGDVFSLRLRRWAEGQEGAVRHGGNG